MSRGQPDFGMYAPKEVSASISDMGEVAARLGSIVIYDKRGDVIDFDNFEEPLLRWSPDLYGDGSYARLDSSNARSGSQSLHLHSADEADALAYVERGVQVVGTKRLGTEISFSKLSTDCDLLMDIYYRDAEGTRSSYIKIDPNAKKIYVYEATDGFVEVASIGAIHSETFMFHTVKFVADFNTRKYVRLLYDLTEYDISALDVWFGGIAEPTYLIFDVYLKTRVATGGDVWIDDSIFTQAEP